MWDKVGGGLELKRRVVTTCEVPAETISAAGEWWTASYMFCYTLPNWKSSATPRARSEAEKMEVLKLTAMRWKLCLPHASSWGNNCITCSFRIVYWVAFVVLVSVAWHCCAPLRHGDSATFRCCSCPVLWKSAILGARCKPWEQLHYLFLPCSPVGSPSWCLFLWHDIAMDPYATTTVLRLNAASPPYCGKVLFWAHTTSRTNKWNVYVSHWLAVLTLWVFLLFCDIIFTEVFALCNINSREGGLRGGAGQPGHAWVVPNNSDRLWFKCC